MATFKKQIKIMRYAVYYLCISLIINIGLTAFEIIQQDTFKKVVFITFFVPLISASAYLLNIALLEND